MSDKWNINKIKKIAGLPLTESWHDDDGDEDPDAKIASSDARQKKFEQKNKGELSAAEKAAAAKKAEAKKPEPKAEEKKAEDKPAPAKAEEKKEEAAAEAKRRGKAPNPESFNQHAKANAIKMTRGAFIKWAAETHGKGKNYASALFAKYNPKSSRGDVKNECWILVHPQASTFVLAENREMNQMQWVDASSNLNTLIFATEAEAKKMQVKMSEWKAQSCIIEKIVFTD